MSKSYYTDYVRHALRFYTRNCVAQPMFKSDADKRNWIACYEVLRTYSPEKHDLIVSVYSGRDTLADEVYNASINYNIDQGIIWDLMKDTERKIAKRRKLL